MELFAKEITEDLDFSVLHSEKIYDESVNQFVYLGYDFCFYNRSEAYVYRRCLLSGNDNDFDKGEISDSDFEAAKSTLTK